MNLTNNKTSLTLNALSNWFSLGINVMIGFFLTPFIISHVGKSGYGIWTLVGTIVGYYGLLNLGVPSAINRYVAKYSTKNDAKSLNRVVNTALLLFSLTALIVFSLTILFSDKITTFFNISPEQYLTFKYLLYMLGIAVAITFPAEVLGAVVVAREHFVPYNIFTSCNRIIYAITIVIMLSSGWGLLGIGLTQLLTATILIFGYYLLFRIFAKDIQISFKYFDFKTLKMILAFGIISTIIMISDIIRVNIDNIIIGKFVNLESVAVYGIAGTLINYFSRLIISSMFVLNPRFTQLDSTGDHRSLKHLFLNSLYISSFLAFAIGMLIIIFGGNFIMFWVGDKFLNASLILVILSIATVFELCQNPSIGLMYSLNKHRFYAYVSIIEAFINLSLSIILVHKYGMIGVALGSLFAALLIKIFVMPIYTSKIINIPLLQYIKPILPSFLSSVIIVIIMYFLNLIDHDLNYLYLSIKLILVIFSYLILNYIFGEKETLNALLSKLTKRSISSYDAETELEKK